MNNISQPYENKLIQTKKIFQAQKVECDIFLLKKSERTYCSSWLSLARKGELTPETIMSFSDIEEVYNRVDKKGIKQDFPLLLAHGTADQMFKIYFLELLENFEDLNLISSFVEDLCLQVKKLFMDHLGLYISPENNVVLASGETLFSLVLRSLILVKPSLKFFILQGSYSYNEALNFLLELKKIISEKNIVLNVNH